MFEHKSGERPRGQRCLGLLVHHRYIPPLAPFTNPGQDPDVAPPSEQPRLSELTPTDVAIDVCDAVWAMCHQLTLSLGLTPPTAPDPSNHVKSKLGTAVVRLVQFAKGEQPEVDTSLNDSRLVLESLYGCAALAQDDDTLPTAVDLSTAIGVTLIAARARLRLASSSYVSTRELAAMASLSIRQIQVLINQGKLKATQQGVAPREAKRWLASRGVLNIESTLAHASNVSANAVVEQARLRLLKHSHSPHTA